MTLRVLILPGDGVGPEVTEVAARVLTAVAGDSVSIEQGLIGGAAIDQTGGPMPAATLAAIDQADAVLLGAVGGPKWDQLPAEQRPEMGLFALRRALDTPVCLRPIRLIPGLVDRCPLRPELAARGVDLMIVRELTGGLYFGPRGRTQVAGGWRATDTMVYESGEIERVVRFGFEVASRRRGRLISVDKANVLECSRLWREIAEQVSEDFPDVEMENMLVDTCALNMVARPDLFDVMVTENTFGDILSDLGGALVGSMGLLPSASLNPAGARVLYEPVHGSAPDIAGRNMANPAGAVLSVAMLLDLSLGRPDDAAAVQSAVEQVLTVDARTVDLADPALPVVGTRELGELILKRLTR